MGDVIQLDPFTSVIRDDVPAHIDTYGQMMLIVAFSALAKLRDSASNDHSRKHVDAIVKQLGALLSRYEPDGVA
ncbi:MAG: hypothetical protein ACRER8_22200 [Pseudomonas sp.]|uniref:hypothetical protein n=1 Tax=Pseudomonas sp. TaxID=306 RepID=UPI003D6F2E0D